MTLDASPCYSQSQGINAHGMDGVLGLSSSEFGE